MRSLTLRQANRCETAKTKRCKCRCKGGLHGKMRHEDGDRAFFEGLDENDPHHVSPKKVKPPNPQLDLIDYLEAKPK
jgi:hypothetical protein